MENIILYFKQGSTDKVYQAAINERNGAYTVDFAYGRRGTTLATGTKTQNPVTLAEATRLFNKLVTEKSAKGYTQGEDGTPYLHSDKKASGVHPQLLNSIDESELASLIANNSHIMQEKFDGRRLMLCRSIDGFVEGVNKLGVVCGFPSVVLKELKDCEFSFLMDGEIVGDYYYAFDLLEFGGADLRTASYRERYLKLFNLLASFSGHAHIQLVRSTVNPFDKHTMFKEIKDANGEGVVFKESTAPYHAGRPHTGGPQLKFKFHATASFIMSGINAKRSVGLSLYGPEIPFPTFVGNVTIPPNYIVPKIGEIVEVRYLYAYKGGRIFQPVYLGVRDDIEVQECTVDQLKYKAETGE